MGGFTLESKSRLGSRNLGFQNFGFKIGLKLEV